MSLFRVQPHSLQRTRLDTTRARNRESDSKPGAIHPGLEKHQVLQYMSRSEWLFAMETKGGLQIRT